VTWRRRAPLPPTDELRARLGMNIREHRERLGISQHEVGYRAEVHHNAISPMELGQTMPRIETFIRVAGALRVAPGELADGIIWTPAEVVMVPGDFQVPNDPKLATKAAALREAKPRPRRRK
jgi:transcriptional regulator with XRE-family HTH domain